MNNEKTLRSDLERQVREELKTDNDNPISSATINAVRQKYGLVALPSAADIARNIIGGKR
jgi:hypothetical protein